MNLMATKVLEMFQLKTSNLKTLILKLKFLLRNFFLKFLFLPHEKFTLNFST